MGIIASTLFEVFDIKPQSSNREYAWCYQEQKTSTLKEHKPPIIQETSISSDYIEAMVDLKNVFDCAKEEGIKPIQLETYRTARRTFEVLYEKYPRRYEIYPMPNGHIIVDALNDKGKSVMFSCRPDGSVLCFGDKKSDRKKYSTPEVILDTFVSEAMNKLDV